MTEKIRILFLSSNPWTTSRILVDEEAREIFERIHEGPYRERFELHKHTAIKPIDLQRLLLMYRPHIVHFSGHGSKGHKLILAGTSGRGKTVDQQGLANVFSLYRNQKELIFNDQPGEIAPATQLLSGWGLKFFDYDNDGDPDLLLVNGHPDDMIDSRIPRVRYREEMLMFENVGGSFKDVSAISGSVFKKVFSGRGMAVGDFDNDGDTDVLTSNNGEPPLLLRNQGGNQNNWVGLNLVATKSNPAAVGALISWQVGNVKRTRLKTGGGSYLSSHDPREILGLGSATKIDFVEIRWPSGKVDRLTGLPLNSYCKVVEGVGLVSK